MTKFGRPTRRLVISALAIAPIVASQDPVRAVGAPGKSRKDPHGAVSSNGWPIAKSADRGDGVWTRSVPGTRVSFASSTAGPSVLFSYLVGRFHYEICPLGEGDVIGYRPPGTLVTGQSDNHSSGTAISILSRKYPPGVSGGFKPSSLAILRDVLRSLEGIVVWGGDFDLPDESLFQIRDSASISEVQRLSAALSAAMSRPQTRIGSMRFGG